MVSGGVRNCLRRKGFMTDKLTDSTPTSVSPIQFLKISAIVHDLGYSCVPGNGKQPLVAFKPYTEAPPTEAQVLEWVKDDPGAIALFLPASHVDPTKRLVVIDDDGQNRDWIEAEFGKTPLMVKTSRGMHYYYRFPAGVSKVTGRNKLIGPVDPTLFETQLTSTGEILWGPNRDTKRGGMWGGSNIDVKATDNYVLCPGTVKIKEGKVTHVYRALDVVGHETKSAISPFNYLLKNPELFLTIPEFDNVKYEKMCVDAKAKRTKIASDARAAARKAFPALAKNTAKHHREHIETLVATWTPTGNPKNDALALMAQEPFFAWTLTHPQDLSYMLWWALAGNLLATFGPELGKELFHHASALDKERYDVRATDYAWDRNQSGFTQRYSHIVDEGAPIEIPAGFEAQSPSLYCRRVLDVVEGQDRLDARYVYIRSSDEVYDSVRKEFVMKKAFLTHESDHGLRWLSRSDKPTKFGQQFEPRVELQDEGLLQTFDPNEIVKASKDPDAVPTLFLDVLNHLCAGDTEMVKHVLYLEAYRFRNMGIKTTALLYWGGHGTGKTVLHQILAGVYGNYYAEVKTAQLESNFNSYADRKLLCYIPECSSNYSKERNKLFALLNSLVTDKRQTINRKNVQEYETNSSTNWNASSNLDVPIMLLPGDRRWTIIEQWVECPHELQCRIASVANSIGGYKHEAAKLRTFFENLDIPNSWSPFKPRDSKAKHEVINGSQSDSQSYWDSGSLGSGKFPIDSVYADYRRWCDLTGVKQDSQRKLMHSAPRTWERSRCRKSALRSYACYKHLTNRDDSDLLWVIEIPAGITARDGVEAPDLEITYDEPVEAPQKNKTPATSATSVQSVRDFQKEGNKDRDNLSHLSTDSIPSLVRRKQTIPTFKPTDRDMDFL